MWQVLAVPLPRRPLFPAGNRLPVTVTDKKLIAEIVDLQRGGRAARAMRAALCPLARAGHGRAELAVLSPACTCRRFVDALVS